MKKIISVIVWLILFATLIAGIVVLYRYTNGFNEDFKTFYIERDGEKILVSKSTATFEPGSEVRFNVGYVFDGSNSAARDYSVTVLPNPEADFDFEAGGLSYAWRMAGSLDEYFSLDKQAEYFTLSVPQGGLEDLLRKIYHETVDLSGVFPESVDPAPPFFLLRVSSYNETVTYDIVFSVIEFAPKSQFYKITYEISGGEAYGLFLNDLPKQGLAGKEITFTARPTGIYYSVSVTVTGSAIEDQSLLPTGGVYSHIYSFIMPACDVVIKFELRSVV